MSSIRLRFATFGFFFALAATSGARTAAADEVTADTCAARAEEAQRKRRLAHLLEAQTELRACAQDVCPRVVRTDCASALAEVEAELPSIIVAVVDERGNDVVDARIDVDGRAVDASLTALPISLDPGSHTVHATAGPGRAAEAKLMVRLGEQRRAVRLVLPASAAVTRNAVHPPPERSSFAPPAVYVLTGVGAAALVTFGVFGVRALEGAGDLRRCAPRCSEDEISTTRRDGIIADVALGVGVVALAAATVIYLLERRTGTPTATTPGTWRF